MMKHSNEWMLSYEEAGVFKYPYEIYRRIQTIVLYLLSAVVLVLGLIFATSVLASGGRDARIDTSVTVVSKQNCGKLKRSLAEIR